MPDALRRLARRIDRLIPSGACLSQPLIIEAPAHGARAETYEPGDWSRMRRLQTEPFRPDLDRCGSDENYREYLASIQESKIAPVEALLRSFDLTRYGRILELGCGDMPQAHAIHSRHPEILYTATDFDANVISQCSQLDALAGIRKLVFDVTRENLDELRNHDLIVSWSLEFSLTDEQLVKLFAASKRHAVPYLLCTHTAIGPLEHFYRSVLAARLKNKVGSSVLRRMGWLRSAAEIARLANLAGLTLEWRYRYDNHVMLLLTP